MKQKNKIIKTLIAEYDKNLKAGVNKWKHPLVKSIFSNEDKIEAIESILTTFVTMGKKVKKFEDEFSNWLNIKNGIMVNSGSSANLLIFFMLKNILSKSLFEKTGQKEIILPAFTWSTTLFPIIQAGFKPVFIDSDINNFNITPENIEKAITPNTVGICVVHLLGSPCDMDRILKIAKNNNLFLIEDSCEAHGAKWDGKKVGSFGDLSSFSFFFSHHIATGEGGIIVSNNKNYSDKIRAMRAHGWVREMSNYEEIARSHPNIDKRFLFDEIGFNVRPTDVTAALGINQIKKLDDIINERRNNHFFWKNKLSDFEDLIYTIDDSSKGFLSPFVFPVIIRKGSNLNRNDFQLYMEENGVETRTVAAGNLLNQPFASKYSGFEKRFDLSNSDYLMYNSFFWGNSHLVTDEEREYVAKIAIKFLNKLSKG